MTGRDAENAAARRWDLEHTGHGFKDLWDPGAQTPYQVKAATERASGRPPRVRLWEEDHQKMRRFNGWYVFALYSRGGELEEMVRVLTGTVTKAVDDRGGWNRAGHRNMEGRQLKLKVRRFL